MSRIDFYHLQKQTIEQVLPKLVEKAYGLKKNIKILIGNEERVEFLNNHLWTFNDEKFIPHGSKKDGFSDMQPIYLSAGDENPNNATLLFLVDDATIDISQAQNFERIFCIFNGNSDFSLEKAREFWKTASKSGHELYYWQQSNDGVWHQK